MNTKEGKWSFTLGKSRHWMFMVFRRLKSVKLNIRLKVGLFIVLTIVVLGVSAPIITWFPPIKTMVGDTFRSPSLIHPFGTDDLGRDIYSNVIYGIRTSLIIGVSSVVIATLVGILIGVVAGYYGRLVGNMLMRITDITLIMPRFLLALVIASIFGNKFQNIILAIGIVSWTGIARMVRAEFLSIKERPFVEAARTVGLTDRQIILEILPNALPAVIPYIVLEIGNAILTEAGLSFLGVGDPNVPSLGLMLNNAQQYLRVAWWMALFPGMMLFILIVGLNTLGDGLIEHLNPRLRKR